MNVQSKSDVVDGIEYRYSSDWINRLESEQHWQLYWNQHKLMEPYIQPGQHVLEIGVGSGFTANYLRSKGVLVTTIDIDKDKRPDIEANIVSYDFADVYDHILAFEVFEHIPYAQFQVILSRISSACRHYLFLSVPANELKLMQLRCKIPRFRMIAFNISVKRRTIREKHHFWEVGHGEITLPFLRQTFQDADFDLVIENKRSSRHFFALNAHKQTT